MATLIDRMRPDGTWYSSNDIVEEVEPVGVLVYVIRQMYEGSEQSLFQPFYKGKAVQCQAYLGSLQQPIECIWVHGPFPYQKAKYVIDCMMRGMGHVR